MEKIKENLKEQIIERLNLEDVKPADIKDNEPLFGGDLALDSIDALELIVLFENFYGIKVTDPEEGKKVFETINTMADYISKKQTNA
jgi:acyl carrier protein